MAKTVLIVEDERAIVEILKFNLKREGYETLEALDGEAGLQLGLTGDPDLILLDVMLPDIDGFEVCRRIRATGSKMGILMLSAKSQEMDKITGLMTGADDYVTKPFSPAELLARVDVVLRRYNKTDAVIEIGGLRIDTRAMQVWRGAEEISLTHKEYDLLLFFARNPGTALYRETIYEHVWGGEYSYGSKTVDLHIQRLRKKVGWENRLLAVNKVGYRLEV